MTRSLLLVSPLQGCTAFSLPRSLPGCRWSFAAAILHGRDPLNARVTTYALIAIIGDIQRFATSKKLVSYLGLNPSVVESGEFAGSGALRQHGRGSLRALLIQASKRLLTTSNPLQKWGLSVALRRGSNKAAVAVARKLTVAVWHVLKSHWNQLLEEITTLLTKLTKLATELGVSTLKELVLRTHP